MKILKIKKHKKNEYEVVFENLTLFIYEDLILKYQLLLRKNVSLEEVEQIKKENSLYACYEKSLNYLSKKMRTKKEVEAYLKKNEFSKEAISYAISKLENGGYLEEEKYIKAFLNDKLKFSLDGPEKLRKTLKDLGLEERKIEENITKIPFSVWQEKINKMIEKKIKSNHKDSEKILKKKLQNDLFRNGYSYEEIKESLERFTLSDEKERRKKEEEKLRKKLSSKFSGEILEYQIKQKLYQKGFDE